MSKTSKRKKKNCTQWKNKRRRKNGGN